METLRWVALVLGGLLVVSADLYFLLWIKEENEKN